MESKFSVSHTGNFVPGKKAGLNLVMERFLSFPGINPWK
jgi:hypothetical protein